MGTDMPTKTQPNHPNERPDQTTEQNMEAAVRDTFPASDPAASTSTQGARAVPPEEMMERSGSKPAAGADSTDFTMRFKDHEAAKLALETLVREGPLDRRCAEFVPAGGATLKISTTSAEVGRFKELLHRTPGAVG
jgi:hypothetical protein